MREMMVEQKDVFYYVTMMNENYAQPDLRAGSEADIIRGCYYFSSYPRTDYLGLRPERLAKGAQVTLLGSGAILTEVIKAAELLAAQGIDATVFSVTSWSELARDGAAWQKRALNGDASEGQPFIAQQLKTTEGPIISATDYVRAVPESIRAFLPEGRSYLTLGTDGFGRSDTRAALREFFGVNAQSIVKAALHLLKSA
jgi:pyruvate dehydrogenase E1 component